MKKVETLSQPAETVGWVAKTRAFLEIPNPAIVRVFGISSFATFASGIALAIEWLCHGKSHSGFVWIIYYALFLICLPLLILIGLRIFMASRGGSSQIADSVAAKEPCVDVPKAQPVERNSCRSLAVVVESDEMKNIDNKTPRMKRAVSFPSHGKVRSCRTR
ncbi:hypothetical protein EUTSA_v10000606mg [Eutrema salsugineum]|uniref:Transmembrane protein n=1 Tax=Eutrema salsugineum TaxID=72664 RepID=V4LU79_EUTSA|nr:uncharacterized protein LOC18022002 [Eutrema salsugineum]ESQ46017.1 hypothetical protein EUTSA_v10000606mg [Eutrema salsugineum]